jgi:hypothetical protein
MNQVIERLREAYPNLIIGYSDATIHLNDVIHYKKIFNLIKDIASIKEYVLEPTNGYTKITLHEFK